MAEVPKLGPRDAGKMLNHGYYYDQLSVGMKFRTMGRTIFEADLQAFCNITWMLEEGFVNTRPNTKHDIKGRFVPGMLVYTFAEGLVVPSFNFTGLAFLQNELNHTGPTVIGDSIHVEVEITEIRRASKGNRGLVRSINHVVNQRDEAVLIYKPLRLMAGSPAAAK